ncbi:uncharacterized protein ACIGJ3_012300 [Trichechus inunguis]
MARAAAEAGSDARRAGAVQFCPSKASSLAALPALHLYRLWGARARRAAPQRREVGGRSELGGARPTQDGAILLYGKAGGAAQCLLRERNRQAARSREQSVPLWEAPCFRTERWEEQLGA